MFTLSLNSQVSEASLAKLWREVEDVLGRSEDPLEILIAEEEEQKRLGAFTVVKKRTTCVVIRSKSHV